DALLVAGGMRALGARTEDASAGGCVERAGDGGAGEAGAGTAWRVTPGQVSGAAVVDVGNAGTVLRFVPPAAAALARADVEFRGDERAAARPVGPLLAALRELGAVIDDQGRGAVPFVVRGRGGISGGTVALDASWSSQL